MFIFNFKKASDESKNIVFRLMYKFQIYICGEVNIHGFDNKKIIRHLDSVHDISVCSSNQFNEEEKLIALMGTKLCIYVFNENNLHEKEIEAANKLKIPILRIMNTNRRFDIYEKCKEYVYFESFEYFEKILCDKYKIISEVKEEIDVPFKYIDSVNYVGSNFKYLEFIDSLNSPRTLLLGRQHYLSHSLSKCYYYLYELSSNCGDSLIKLNNLFFQQSFKYCLNKNKLFQYDSEKFIIYDVSGDEDFQEESQILDINEFNQILVDEKNIYGIERYSNHLYIFNENYEIMDQITKVIDRIFLMKFFKNRLFILSGSYYENYFTDQIEEISSDNNLYISIYTKASYVIYNYKEYLSLEKKFPLHIVTNPRGLHISEKYVMTIGNYKNKIEMIVLEIKYLFIFNHDGILLHKTNLEIKQEITDFIIINSELFLIQLNNTDVNEKNFNLKKIKFSKTDFTRRSI